MAELTLREFLLAEFIMNEEQDKKEKKNKASAKKWMIKELQTNPQLYDDCGERNCTKLAENCADALDIYEEEEYCTIPTWIFDLAVDVKL